MPSRTIENYLKQIYLEQQTAGKQPVAMGRLAAVMGVVPGTATTMVKALADSRLVEYSPRSGVRLTRAGSKLALHVLRRHRLVESFLVRVVGLDWAEVHDEAEELEHVISEKLLDRIDALLGHPTADPHGDPIPTAAGRVARSDGMTLATCPAGKPIKIARIIDQEPKFLRFAREKSLVPGEILVVRERSVESDAVVVATEARKHVTLSTAAARKFAVQPVPPTNRHTNSADS